MSNVESDDTLVGRVNPPVSFLLRVLAMHG